MFLLYSYFFSKKFKLGNQSGYYIDFLLKHFFESVLRSVFLYTAQFFCEKYIIEGYTKKIFSNSIYFINLFFKTNNFDFSFFF